MERLSPNAAFGFVDVAISCVIGCQHGFCSLFIDVPRDSLEEWAAIVLIGFVGGFFVIHVVQAGKVFLQVHV